MVLRVLVALLDTPFLYLARFRDPSGDLPDAQNPMPDLPEFRF